jgi:hypothetical protein
LWVREAFALVDGVCHYEGPPSRAGEEWHPVYRADEPDLTLPRWYPGIHMPRWVCRLVLEVTAVRVELLQAITAADAIAEGVEPAYTTEHWTYYDPVADSYPSVLVEPTGAEAVRHHPRKLLSSARE